MHVEIAGYTRHIDKLLLESVRVFEEKILNGRVSSYEEYKYALGRIQGLHEARAVIHELRDKALTNAGEGEEYD